MEVRIDPTARLVRKRGGMTWLLQPGLHPVVTLVFAIGVLFIWSLWMNGIFQIILAAVIAYLVFILGVAFERYRHNK